MDETTNRPEPERRTEPTHYVPTGPKPPVKRRLWRRVRLIFGLCIAAGLVFASYQVIRTARQAPPPTGGGRFASSGPQAVGAATIGKSDIRIIVNALGTVTPIATVTVRTQINGQLTEVAFTEGQMVKHGDFLAQIDQRPYQLLQEQYEGQLARDQGLLNQAKADLARYQRLLKQDSIAKQQAENQVYVVQQYEGTVKTDQALVDTQKLNIAYCRIVAPVDGRLGLRLVDPGNYVQTSDANGLAMITRLDPISVLFSVPEDTLPDIMAQLKDGTTLAVMAYDRANVKQLATGRVVTLDNQVDTTTGTVRLRAMFGNPDDKLFPNQFVNVQLLVKTLHDAVAVPNAALQRGAPGAYVYLINADDTVSVRPVTPGPVDGDMTAVTAGLAPGDRVVVDGADRLRDGAKVTIPGTSRPSGGGPGGAAGPGGPAQPGAPDGSPDRRRGGNRRQQGAP